MMDMWIMCVQHILKHLQNLLRTIYIDTEVSLKCTDELHRK